MNTLDKIKIMQAYLDGHRIACVNNSVGDGEFRADSSGCTYFHISDKVEPRWSFSTCTYTVLPKERWAVMATDKRSGATYMIYSQTYDTKEAAKDMADKRGGMSIDAYYTVVKVTE